MNKTSRAALIVVIATALLGTAGLYTAWLSVRQKLYAERTLLNMRTVAVVLASTSIEPQNVSTDQAALALKLQGVDPAILIDAWGNPLLLEVESWPEPSDSPRIKIISLGRDGQRGSCCQGEVAAGSWDEDAVIVGTDWQQHWSI